MQNLAAERIKKELGLKPHPEGGWYAESFRDKEGADGRGHSTAIYFLLEAGDVLHDCDRAYRRRRLCNVDRKRLAPTSAS